MKSPLKINLPHLKAARREQRNNPTPAELFLWQFLRKHQLAHKIRRQQSIGPYVVDFYCPSAALVIELDGGYHEDAAQKIMDEVRDQTLQKAGFRVLRFTNAQAIKAPEMVVARIKEKLEA